MTEPVMSIDKWATNGDLIADCGRLGYLRDEWSTLDPTYGYGTFWKTWRPSALTCHDLNPEKAPHGPQDFTALPYRDGLFDAVVFDPPYKLNGTPSDTGGMDERFGVDGDKGVRWQDRMALCEAGVRECARVLNETGFLLVKCQDQVVSGKLRWQTIRFTEVAEECGLGLADRFDFLSYRPQPHGTSQKTARRCSSQLLVFKRGWSWRAQQISNEAVA
jgi:hypothetical protein